MLWLWPNVREGGYHMRMLLIHIISTKGSEVKWILYLPSDCRVALYELISPSISQYNNKGQTTTPGTSCPTLYEKRVGSPSISPHGSLMLYQLSSPGGSLMRNFTWALISLITLITSRFLAYFRGFFIILVPLRTKLLYMVYKIPCAIFPWSYFDATGRCFSTRKKEHIQNVKHASKVPIFQPIYVPTTFLLTLKLPV